MRAPFLWLGIAWFGSLARLGQTEPAPAPSVALLAAESAFREGLRSMKEGKFSEAARRFEESQGLEPASGTLINLAYCHRRLGKPVSAWLDYQRAIALAEASHKPAHAELARHESTKLEPTLPRLQLSIVGPRANLAELSLDGEALAEPAWALPIPLDPGSHHLRARFYRGPTRDWDLELAPGKLLALELEVPDAGAGEAAASPPELAPTPLSGASPPALQPGAAPPALPAPLPGNANSSATWVRGFAWSGVAVTTLGAALFVSARVEYDAARDHCSSGNACGEPYYGRELAAADRARVGVVIGTAGLSMLGAAALLHFTLPGPRESEARLGALVTPGRCVGTFTTAF